MTFHHAMIVIVFTLIFEVLQMVCCRYSIDLEQVQVLRDTGMKWNQIARILNISERTLRRHREQLGHTTEIFTDMSDDQLDAAINSILQSTTCGEFIIFSAFTCLLQLMFEQALTN